MKVDFYDYNGLGYVVDPESDTKIVPVILIGPQPVKCIPVPPSYTLQEERWMKSIPSWKNSRNIVAIIK